MSTHDDLLTIGGALADIAESVEKGRKETPKLLRETVKEVAREIGAPIAELDGALRANAAVVKEALAQLTKASARNSETASAKQPPPIQPAAGWVFDVEYLPNGAIKRLIAKRLDQ